MKKMQSLLAVAIAAICTVAVATAELAPAKADAGDVWLATMTTDGGAAPQTSWVQKINPQVIYCLQPLYANTCYKLSNWDGGVASFTADCTKDEIIPQGTTAATTSGVYPEKCFESAGRTAVVVSNLDGGIATTNLFLREKNKSADLAPHLP